MVCLNITGSLLPCFHLLNNEEIEQFERTISGKKILEFITNHTNKLELLNKESNWFNWKFWAISELESKLLKEFEQEKLNLFKELEAQADIISFNELISLKLFLEIYPDSNILPTQEILSFIRKEACSSFLKKIKEIKETINNLKTTDLTTAFISFLQSEVDGEFIDINRQLNTSQEALLDFINNDEQFKSRIISHKRESSLPQIESKAIYLANAFPYLYYRTDENAHTMLQQLIEHYFESDIQKALADHLLFSLNFISQSNNRYLNLNTFNTEQANKLSTLLIQQLNNRELVTETIKSTINNWLSQYERDLINHSKETLKLINGKPKEPKQSLQMTEMAKSLSYYLLNNAVTKEIRQRINMMADAHAFIQATSFSTQNESSLLAILDIYNYVQYHQPISEAKTILGHLIRPLKPLYNEYKDIALYERNLLKKLYRVLVPLCIIAGVIVAVALMLPIGIPELAFIAAFVPALIAGLALATLYVYVKDDLYKKFRAWYYNGAYNIPEFEVNERMTQAFGSLAEQIREFYIDAIKTCNETEELYQAKQDKGILDENDIALRKENLKLRGLLNFEWYDIHSNYELDFKQSRPIALSRLREMGEKEYSALLGNLEKDIPVASKNTTQKIEAAWSSHQPVPNNGENLIRISQSPSSFFKLPCFENKERVEHMAMLAEGVSAIV